jgi:hypothetical protein
MLLRRLKYVRKQINLEYSQGNGPVCQVETSPEIFLAYRAHLVTIVRKILVADMRCKDVKKLPKFGTYSSDLRTSVTAARIAVALYSPVHSDGVRRPDADKAVKDLRNVTHTHTYICVCFLYVY